MSERLKTPYSGKYNPAAGTDISIIVEWFYVIYFRWPFDVMALTGRT